MNSKSILIAIAAFAVTAGGAQAYGGASALSRAGLDDDQISALEEARSLRAAGDAKRARDVLLEAGIDEAALDTLREAAKKTRQEMHQALANDDYDAFILVIADSPLSDIVRTKEDFELFRQAHEYRLTGAHEEAKEIFDSFGLPVHGDHFSEHKILVGRLNGQFDLSAEQRDALATARQANDRKTVRAILEEAGGREARETRGG